MYKITLFMIETFSTCVSTKQQKKNQLVPSQSLFHMLVNETFHSLSLQKCTLVQQKHLA